MFKIKKKIKKIFVNLYETTKFIIIVFNGHLNNLIKHEMLFKKILLVLILLI